MITTVGLVNIHHQHSYNFFLVMRSLKESFLTCNFAVERYMEDIEKNVSFIQNKD